MDIPTLALFAGALLVAAGSPGPSIAALVARVLASGHKGVFPFLAAMWIGEAIWLALAVWGLAAIAETFQLVFLILKWVGVGYLLFLAYKMWTAPATLDPAALPQKGSARKLFMAGLTVTLGNPKIMVFYLALLPSIIDLRQVSISGWLELTATMLAVLIFIDIAWTLFAAQARRLLKSHRAVRIANRTSASIMAGAAAAIATR